jgi:hypothetical protein
MLNLKKEPWYAAAASRMSAARGGPDRRLDEVAAPPLAAD